MKTQYKSKTRLSPMHNTIYLLCLLLLTGCSSQKGAMDTPDIVESVPEVVDDIHKVDVDTAEERTLDELVVTSPRDYVLPVYHAAAERMWDLEQMDLDVRFDWEKEYVLGQAVLKLKPYFYTQNSLVLDAKGFDINSIRLSSGQQLEFTYDGLKLNILLDREYTNQDKLTLRIDYVAKPSEGPVGGSAAITSDKGLFFINPRGEDPNKPQQIWTQGETENNSNWFPTIDKPNENLTHRISITVQDRFVTLSNGELVSSTVQEGNMRTDTYVMSQPHAPYLVMMAIGEFAVVKETVDGLDYEYYVEKEYEAYAKDIFAHTPEMMRFFADKLDYPYPWNKYSQIITHDYVSGAMENTTAVIFGDFIQKTERQLIDNGNDYIVAHELFHHWFGDLVTCESWANLTLQEGFANYSEHLWQEYKYGQDAADYQRHNELQGYLSSIMGTGIHPLIHYGYGDKEEMFDGHSYNKGGLVLHMLRHEIGDDAFWKGLNKYLNDHKFTAVEVDELRMAFEDVTGRDLQWFFDQWYLDAGHPEIEIAHSWDPDSKKLTLQVDQHQDPEASRPIFILPVRISVYDQMGKETQFDITINKRSQEITFDYATEPALVIFDSEDNLLFVKNESKTPDEYARQYQWSKTYLHRWEAINNLVYNEKNAAIFETALLDQHFSIRELAIGAVDILKPDILSKIKSLVTEDAHSVVRAAAISKLNIENDPEIIKMINDVIANEKSYAVIGSALSTLSHIAPDQARNKIETLSATDKEELAGSIGAIYGRSGDQQFLSFFEDRLLSIGLSESFSFYDSYFQLLEGLTPDEKLEKADLLYNIGWSKENNIYYRYNGTITLYKLKNTLSQMDANIVQKMNAMIDDIKKNETNPQLLQQYSLF